MVHIYVAIREIKIREIENESIFYNFEQKKQH